VQAVPSHPHLFSIRPRHPDEGGIWLPVLRKASSRAKRGNCLQYITNFVKTLSLKYKFGYKKMFLLQIVLIVHPQLLQKTANHNLNTLEITDGSRVAATLSVEPGFWSLLRNDKVHILSSAPKITYQTRRKCHEHLFYNTGVSQVLSC
jgi:hypothetical protein